MMQSLLPECIRQRADDVLLSYQFSERFGAPLSGENLSHGRITNIIQFAKAVFYAAWRRPYSQTVQPAN